MLDVVGGGNTPCISEEYYCVPPCGGLACKIFGTPKKGSKHLHINKN
jgi:hypothetical protein